MTKDNSDAENLVRSMALRMESHFPAAAAAVLSARTAELLDGELVITFDRDHRESFKAAKQLERGMRYYTDHPVSVRRS